MFFFYDILKGNKRFSTKTKRSNSRKIEIFLKGLVHGFGQKLAIFPTFFSRQYCPPFAIFNLYNTVIPIKFNQKVLFFFNCLSYLFYLVISSDKTTLPKSISTSISETLDTSFSKRRNRLTKRGIELYKVNIKINLNQKKDFKMLPTAARIHHGKV